MTHEQYAESLIDGYKHLNYKKYGLMLTEAACTCAISDIQHTIEALEKVKKVWWTGWLIDELTYYQQALTYLQNKLK